MFGDYEKNWFADAATARAWQRAHGAYLVRYGEQTVAILAPASGYAGLRNVSASRAQ
jgi:hypothetical protein